jgi:hypothetical protein
MQDHLRDVVELVAANTRLSEVLAESHREVLAKSETINSARADRLEVLVQWLCVCVAVLIAFGVIGGIWVYRELDAAKAEAMRATSEVLDTQTRVRYLEIKVDSLEEMR